MLHFSAHERAPIYLQAVVDLDALTLMEVSFQLRPAISRTSHFVLHDVSKSDPPLTHTLYIIIETSKIDM